MIDWPHSPIHRLTEVGAYLVTCGTYQKLHYFQEAERLRTLTESLLGVTAKDAWNLQAWAVFSNHYHFVAASSPDSGPLRILINELHSSTARWVNQQDGTPGRKVWFQYWETRLTFQKSYLSRLSYVHRNAVHHRLVAEPSLYPWCSAGWLQRRAPPSFYKTLMRFGIERLRIPDEFDVQRSAADI